jgi:hypothetical protein
MKSFTDKFEDHKIPEFYDKYFDYGAVKKIISEFKQHVPKLSKMKGFYNFDTDSKIVYKLEPTSEDLD